MPKVTIDIGGSSLETAQTLRQRVADEHSQLVLQRDQMLDRHAAERAEIERSIGSLSRSLADLDGFITYMASADAARPT